LLFYQGSVTGDPFQDPRLLFWEHDRLGFGPETGERQNAFRLEPTAEGLAQIWFLDPAEPPRGHTLARGLHNITVNWRQLEQYLYGWIPLLTVSFVWILCLSGYARAYDWLLLVVGGALLVAHVFYWADGVAYGPRYLYAALPVFLLLTARGVWACSRFLGGRRGRRATAVSLLILVMVALLFNGPAFLAEYQGYNFVDAQKLDLVKETVTPPALVFVDSGQDWWEYGSLFSGNNPWLDGPIIFARDLGEETNARLRDFYPRRHAYRLQGNVLQSLP
jgi:hypothetical protein